MSRDLNKEVRTLRKKVMTCLQETKITDKAFTNLIFSIVWLLALFDQEGKTKNSKERRRIIREFKRRKKGIEEDIQSAYEQTER